MIGKIGVSSIRPPVVIHMDEAALYLMVIMDASSEGYKKTIAGISAISMIKEYQVNYNIYREFIDRSSVEYLLEDSKTVMHNLVIKNETLENRLLNIYPDKSIEVNDKENSSNNYIYSRLGNSISFLIVGGIIWFLFWSIKKLIILVRKQPK
jgi:hypothetical protein